MVMSRFAPETMARNCREAAARLRETGLDADMADARALAAAAVVHDAEAERLRQIEESKRSETPRYWWQEDER